MIDVRTFTGPDKCRGCGKQATLVLSAERTMVCGGTAEWTMPLCGACSREACGRVLAFNLAHGFKGVVP